MPEINPEHLVTRAVHDMWHTLCLILIKKQGLEEVVISPQDFADIPPNSLAISVQELPDGLHLKILSMEAAKKLADEERENQIDALNQRGI